jgi:hypothetical protein
MTSSHKSDVHPGDKSPLTHRWTALSSSCGAQGGRSKLSAQPRNQNNSGPMLPNVV